MIKGVNASDGIGIGVARVAVEPDLSFEPRVVKDIEAEQARYKEAIAKFIAMTDKQIESMMPASATRPRWVMDSICLSVIAMNLAMASL